ncbi:MAG: aldehyde dehydrogenase family protein [Geminicoccaceae bacterium]|nr:aldehyde dehydrogenase family protein [Geminicoccaceae bacterium]
MTGFDDLETRLLIDGEWRRSLSGERFTTYNPATGDPVAEVERADRRDARAAVSSARHALESGPWATMTGAERGRILRRLADLLRAETDALVGLEALDGGKPVRATRRQDLPAAIDCLEYYAGWADKIDGVVVPARRDALTFTTRGPVGVVAAIVPWNFPLMNAVWKIAPALACGCTVVLKPAELTPLSALRLGQLALDAGLPPGVLNVLPGFGKEAGAALVEHPGVNKISFTGSPGVGRWIMGAASANLTRVGLELGGKSPNVVFDDADLDAAVRQSAAGVFFNAGQVCSAGTRLYVEDGVHDEFVERLAARAGALVVGDPLDPKTTLGPLISAGQLDKVLGYVETGRREGAALVAGGGRVGNRGHFLEPTVFAGAGNDMRFAREEIFGPVAAVIRFKGEDEAVRLANDSPYSLAAALWSRDLGRAHHVAGRLRAGTVWVNTYGHTDARLPWGGHGGDSGLGRDLGEAALENYTETKTVWVSLARPRAEAPRPEALAA